MRHLLAPVVLAACVVSACTPAVEEPTTAPPSSPTASVSASPSPTPEPSPSPTVAESFPPAPASESPEQAAVRAAWMEYWRVRSEFVADPTLTDLTPTQAVTTGEAQDLILRTIRTLRESGSRSTGGLVFRNVEVGEPASGATEATVSYCLDRGNLSLVDADGKPIASEGPTTLTETTTLSLGADGIWRVAQIRNEPAAC